VKRIAACVVTLSWVASVAAGPGAAAAVKKVPRYTAEYLGPAVGAAAMNSKATVVGTSTSAGTFGWVAGPGLPITPLPLPAGMQSSEANDVNESGVVVGAVSESSSTQFGPLAVVWIPDGAGSHTVGLLGKLPGDVGSVATALNDVGDIVGYSTDGTFRRPVLFTAADGILDLTPTGVFDPSAINDQRVLVDQSFTVKRLDLDTMVAEDLGVPAGPPTFLATRSSAINESNQVAGLAISASTPSCDRYAARYTDGVGWEVFSGCGSANGAYDMNDRGDVVMRLNVAPYVRFEGLGTFRIEDLIENDVGHWYVINGYGVTINDARQLVVPASNPGTGQSGLILLTPKSPALPGRLDRG